MLYKIAWELGKTIGELQSLPLDEYEGWVAFFQIQDEQSKKETARRSRMGKRNT